MRIWIAGGEPSVANAVVEVAAESGHDLRVEPAPSPGSGEALIDLGLPPSEWSRADTPGILEAARARELVARIPNQARLVRASVIGAELEARSRWQRAHGAAEDILRQHGNTVCLRAGILLGECGLTGALRRAIERSRVVAIAGISRSKLEPLALVDFARYCVEAASAPGPFRGIYDLGCGEILTGGLLTRGLADNLGVSRWIVPVPRFLRSAVASTLGSRDFPSVAVDWALEALGPGLLPRRMSAWEDFTVQPMDLRDAVARAVGMIYPLRQQKEGRFENWRSPGKKGILWSKRR